MDDNHVDGVLCERCMASLMDEEINLTMSQCEKIPKFVLDVD